MKIEVVGTFPIEQAFAKAREACLENAGDQEIYFYKDAEMRLVDFYPEELNPVSMYLLNQNLEFQRKFREHLMSGYGIDTLCLSEVVHLKTPDGIVGLVPPYVEVSQEKVSLYGREGYTPPPDKPAYLNIPLIIDGLHRAKLASELNTKLRCIVVSSPMTIDYPYASYPVPWSKVSLYDEVPPVKKHYRREDKYTFMRPLTAFRLMEATEAEYNR